MRYLLLLMLALSLPAAEKKALPREDFTLTDGRNITGIYDEDRQRLTLDGGKMSLTITPDQIKERKPVDPLAGTALADKPSGPDVKSMTPEQKAAAVAGFQKGQRQKEIAELIRSAERDEKEAEKLSNQAKMLSENPTRTDDWQRNNAIKIQNDDRVRKLIGQINALTKKAAEQREKAAALTAAMTPPVTSDTRP